MAFNIIAHRGDNGTTCENSVDGLRAVDKMGAKWAEVDVRLNAEGSFICAHDKTADRTTKQSGYFHEMDDGEVRDLVTNCNGYVPFLARMLEVCHDETGLELFLDIKADPLNRWSPEKFAELRDLLVRKHMGHRAVIFTWHESFLAASQSVAPNTRTALIGAPNRPCLEEAAKHWSVHVHADEVSPEYVIQCNKADTHVILRNTSLIDDWRWGRHCGVWGTMTDEVKRGLDFG